jgi:hypothetical protein
MPDPRDRPSARQLVEWLSGVLVAPAPVGPAHAPSRTDAASRRGAATTFWVGVLALVVAGAVTAPAVAAIGVFGCALLLRTISYRADVIWKWRQRRGYRSNDGLLATLCLPWFGFLNLPGALVNAGIAIADGVIVVALLTLTAESLSPSWALAAGGLVAGLLVWSGPKSQPVRAGAHRVTEYVLVPGAATYLIVLCVYVAVLLVLLTFQVVGPNYAPLPSPPWQDSLRGLL